MTLDASAKSGKVESRILVTSRHVSGQMSYGLT